ncbi:TonB-dependent receptor [Sphingobium sufflavum]|uniref:TonB-dependent receptor n=1 Tax=Sphingobium sufflavum TaxID=1129547 RepID=UPI001F393175|nr:TonB-dependent receptor [Sphingobium sufflavum]MCE7795388.1 TonB-dependent receptor [Sphingobium sufflavum]
MQYSYRAALLLASVAVPAVALSSGTAWAADDAAYAAQRTAPADDGAEADAAGGEITVTARRQEENAQDVPIALSVIGGASLERTGGFTLSDIQVRTPSFSAYNSNPRNSSVSVRGIGISSASDGLDTSVGVYIDNVYLGRPGMALADLIDVEQLEVLRGPQGTLFGRNNSAGVLNITTRKPEFTFGGSAELQLGNYGYHQERISLTGPILDDVLAFRVTGFNTHRNGVLPNIKTGIAGNSIGRSGFRAQLLFKPTPNLSIRLIGDYSQEDDTCCVSATKLVLPASLSATTGRTLATLAGLGYVPTGNRSDTSNNATQNMITDQKGLSLQADWDFGFATLTSISAWKYWHFDPLQDSDGTPLDIIQVNVATTKTNQYSQELRLASNGKGPFSWQVGGFLFHNRLRDRFILNQFGYDASAFYTNYARSANPNAAAITIAPGSQYLDNVDTTVDSFAAFGQANYEIVPGLTLTGGIRYTKDKRWGKSLTSINGTPNPATSIPFDYDVTVKNDNVSYLLSAAYKITPDVLVYGSYSTGYKGSGLNLNSAVSAGTPLVLQPEKVRNWEAGIKTELFDKRLTFNIAGFWTELTGLQANITPTNGNRSYLANVGNVRSRGFEVDGTLHVTPQFTLSGSASYNDAIYTSYPNAPCSVGVTGPCDLTGRPLWQAPKWIANGIADYRIDLGGGKTVYTVGQFSYRSGTFGAADAGPYTRIKGYALANLRVGTTFQDGKFDLSAWVNNMFDKRYFQNLSTTQIVGASAFAYAGQLGAPRTWGGTLRVTF